MLNDFYFQDVINLISDIVWEVDEDWRFTFISPQIESATGFKPEELYGKFFFDYIPPDEAERLQGIFNSLSQNRSNITDIVFCFVSKNGKQRLYTLTGIPFFNGKNMRCGYRGIARDITNQKNTNISKEIDESKFVNLFENTPQGIAIADRNGFFIRVNNIWKEMFGYFSSDITRLHINDLRNEHDQTADRKLLKALFNNEMESYRIERAFRKKDGTEFWCRLTTRLFEDPATTETYVIGAYTDISDRIKAESEIKRVHDELETVISLRKDEIEKMNLKVINSQENERQRIARDLHDGVGQTILAAKYAFNSFAHDQFRDESFFNRGMQLIGLASQELREIYSGLYPAMLSDLGLNDTINWYIRNYLEPSGLHVNYQFSIKRTISHDLSVNLYRIIQELFNNIIKHSAADSATVFLREEKGMITIIISDNGSGFNVVTAEKKSAGAGLVNIRRRVEYLKGFIDINSEPGNTTIIIDLPVGKDENE